MSREVDRGLRNRTCVLVSHRTLGPTVALGCRPPRPPALRPFVEDLREPAPEPARRRLVGKPPYPLVEVAPEGRREIGHRLSCPPTQRLDGATDPDSDPPAETEPA